MPTLTPTPDDLYLIRPRDVADRLGVHPMTLWRWREKDPTFPRPVRLGPQSIGYLASELRDWIVSRRLTDVASASMAPRTATGERVVRRPDRGRNGPATR